MKANSTPLFLALAALLAAASTPALSAPPTTGSVQAQEDVMADGEVRKIDLDNRKITIRHGVIRNLDMPGMTMVFQVRDPAMLEKLKTGDKIRFAAEKSGGAIVVTTIEPAR